MKCKICTQIDSRDNIFVPKLDSLWKHAGHHKALVTMPMVKMGDDYILKTIFHVANESGIFKRLLM
jgi:hypothetical protein